MALDTLKGIKEIGGFEVIETDWGHQTDSSVRIDHKNNSISFKLQDGPIKENGVNGCQVDTIIEAAKLIIKGLNEKFPCQENHDALMYLGGALGALELRKKNRGKRGVEGLNKA